MPALAVKNSLSNDSSTAGYAIRHIDLGESLPSSWMVSQPVYTVFWYRNIPLGSVLIQPDLQPMTGTALATLAAQTIAPAIQGYLQQSSKSSTLAELVDMTLPLEAVANSVVANSLSDCETTESFSVSVVVCTRDRPEQLADCVRSLQTLNPSPSEILIVDNNPTNPATRELIDSFSQKKPSIPLRYIAESRPGLSHARNTGIRHSHGDIIAFTDDDVHVHPHWLNPILNAFKNEQIWSVTGTIMPTELNTPTQILFEFDHGFFDHGYAPKTFDTAFFQQHKDKGVPVWDIGAGANMAFRRQVFEQVGLFDPRLGAGASGCSEDSEMWYRILATGGNCCYVPAAVVYHTHRPDQAALTQQMRAYMRGHVTALLVQFETFRHWGNLRRLFIELPPFYWQLLKQAVRHRFTGRYSTYLAEVSGFLNGLPTYLKLRHQRLKNKPEPPTLPPSHPS